MLTDARVLSNPRGVVSSDLRSATELCHTVPAALECDSSVSTRELIEFVLSTNNRESDRGIPRAPEGYREDTGHEKKEYRRGPIDPVALCDGRIGVLFVPPPPL